jgi:peptidoglycan/xylan/chitin deacetylase (PgdA/CDA1 family)
MSLRGRRFAPCLALLAACTAAPHRPPARDTAVADAGAIDSRLPEAAPDAGAPDIPLADGEEDVEEDSGDPSVIASNGCAAGACLNRTCQALGEPAVPGRFLEVGFEARSPYVPADVVIPTLDDAPDEVATGPLLDWLDANQLHADFFVNDAHLCDVAATPACAALLERILRAHNPGNHTAHHLHLGLDCHSLGADADVACEDELTAVESQVQVLSNGGLSHLSRLRAPFGEPFLKGGVALEEMKGVVARFAVEIGWAIDAGDGDRGEPLTAATATANLTRALDAGDRGIVRLPATAPWSLEVMKVLLDPTTGYVPTHHLRVGTVEDAVCWKYGRHSWELVSQITGHRVGEN